MLTFIARRIALSIPVLIVATFLIFVFVSLSSNPLAQLYQNPHITRAEIKTIAHAKGLDQPVIARYWTWVNEAVKHKFGTGVTSPLPIWPQLTRVIVHTLELL